MVTSTLGRALALAALAALMLAVQAFAQRFELPVEKDRTFGSGRGALAQGWLRLGADRTFEFTVTDGVIPPSLVTFLWEHLPNPVVTAVSPAVATTAQKSVPVKLRQRLQGSHGVLELRERRLTYVTDRAEHQRIWRPADPDGVSTRSCSTEHRRVRGRGRSHAHVFVRSEAAAAAGLPGVALAVAV